MATTKVIEIGNNQAIRFPSEMHTDHDNLIIIVRDILMNTREQAPLQIGLHVVNRHNDAEYWPSVHPFHV